MTSCLSWFMLRCSPCWTLLVISGRYHWTQSAKLTTFITPFRRYFFSRLPFGITSAPEIFQREMTDLLKYLEGMVAYMDDILVYAETDEQHEERLQNILDTLSKAEPGKVPAASATTQLLGPLHR